MSSECVRHSVDKFVDSHLLLLGPLQAYHGMIGYYWNMISKYFKGACKCYPILTNGRMKHLVVEWGQELGVHINMQIVHVKPVSKSYYWKPNYCQSFAISYTFDHFLNEEILIRSHKGVIEYLPKPTGPPWAHTQSLPATQHPLRCQVHAFPLTMALLLFSMPPATLERPLLFIVTLCAYYVLLGHETQTCKKTLMASHFFLLFSHLFPPSLTLSIAHMYLAYLSYFLGRHLIPLFTKPEIRWRRGNKKLWASGVRRCTSAIAMESPGGTQPHTHTHMKAAMSWRWVMIQLRYNHMKTLKEKRSLDHAKWLIRIIN